jgi:hypothetical protein
VRRFGGPPSRADLAAPGQKIPRKDMRHDRRKALPAMEPPNDVVGAGLVQSHVTT